MLTKLLSVSILLACIHTSALAQSRTTLFDFDWRFHLGGAQGAEASDFDDSDWRNLDLPHDWSIDDLAGSNSPFTPDAISQVNGGFTVGGTGWYRKSFNLNSEQRDKRIVIQFDGVYMNAEIWVNGQWVGNHPYGYTSFWFDITDKVKVNAANVLAVKVRNEGENSRWYSGSGIYRHVWLSVLEPTHIARWGTFITTPIVTETSATIALKTRVLNESVKEHQLLLVTKLFNREGQIVGTVQSQRTTSPHDSVEFEEEAKIQKPSLWSPDSPTLYRAESALYLNGDLVDVNVNNFGIRTINFDVARGFLLNGQPLKLKGGCLHHDNGPLGARAFDRAEERRVELLKASGYNALRLAHNPPSPAFLEACDRLGMMVIDEAFDMWREGKNPHDYHLFFDEWWKRDLESMLQRDRNHPSVSCGASATKFQAELNLR